MANFEAKEIDLSNINGGQRYQNGDVVDAEAINAPIEASAWAVEKVKEIAANGGTGGGSGGGSVDTPIKYGEGANSAVSGTSRAIGTESVSIGSDNLAGSKAFTIMSLDETAMTYTLDSVVGLAVGDVYSLRLACYNATTGVSDAPQRYNVGAITAINTTTNTVTVDTMFKPSDVGEGYTFQYTEDYADENGIDYETNAFRIIAKPLVGTRTIGSSTIALGSSNQALSKNAVAEGWGNTAYGSHAHAEGYSTEASYSAHSEGKNTVASGFSAHSEGENTVASGNMSHAEGRNTEATAHFAHAEGYYTEASGNQSHAEGSNTHATNYNAHAEGYDTTASGDGAHAEGVSTKATAKDAHAEGNATEATAVHAHAEGQRSKAQYNSAHAEGFETISAGDASHSEGYQTEASNDGNRYRGAHAEGYDTTANGSLYSGVYIGAHAEGYKTEATSVASHAEGKETKAQGQFSHAEGNGTTATKNSTHAEGWSTTASGDNSHAEGGKTTASGNNSHAEGYKTLAEWGNSHAEGTCLASVVDKTTTNPNEELPAFVASQGGAQYTINGPRAMDNGAHAEGVQTLAYGHGSHSEGFRTEAWGDYSHASGEGTKATNSHQFVVGSYNDTGNEVFMVGIGTSDTDRVTGFGVRPDGRAFGAKDPIDNMDFATKQYVDEKVGSGSSSSTSFPSPSTSTSISGTGYYAIKLYSSEYGGYIYSGVIHYSAGSRTELFDDNRGHCFIDNGVVDWSTHSSVDSVYIAKIG